jgi:Uma2 family endonuclease
MSSGLGFSTVPLENLPMSVAVAAETKTHYTPEDLLSMPDGKSYELVDGRLVEQNMGAESSWIGGRLHSRLDQFCEEHRLGWTLPADSGYQCFPHGHGLVRRPDVSFIRAGRLPGGILPKGFIRIPPDLAVEVVSPNDLAYQLEQKLDDYQKAGVPLVWVIYPENRTVFIRRSKGTVTRLHQDDELSGEEVIPGFRCQVRSLFPSTPGPESATEAAVDQEAKPPV